MIEETRVAFMCVLGAVALFALGVRCVTAPSMEACRRMCTTTSKYTEAHDSPLGYQPASCECAK